MTDEIKDILKRYINDKLILAVASNPANKAEGLASKVKIKPVRLKGALMFQAAKTVGAQEMHENADADGTIELIDSLIDESPRFGQIELKNATGTATILISRKGHVTIKEKKQKPSSTTVEKSADNENKLKNKHNTEINSSMSDSDRMHGFSISADEIGGPDRKKNYILQEGIPVPFLVELGVMNREGYVVKARYDKFRQINRYLEFVADVLPELEKRAGTKNGKENDGGKNTGDETGREAGRRLEIIDFGCGKSYLTFALYHFLHESKKLNVHITGLDLKKSVIEECSGLAKKLGYTDLEFKHGDIADYETTGGVDMVVTLHACDTATDYALYNAIRWNAAVIMCVPCCQHELNKQVRGGELEGILKYGIIKERISALMTDAMRAEMLEEQGYRTQILEFIDMEHTPKNLLIRAVKKAGTGKMPVNAKKAEAGYEKLLNSFGAELTLHRLLKPGTISGDRSD